nr:hypothetical protein [Tanacetum cinerariifolium]
MSSMINPDEYSPAETLITFPSPIPLLRQPIPDDNSLILGFPNPNSFSSAYKSCESSILTQCESAARIGCSVAASNNCKPPWWKTLLFGSTLSSDEMKERENCEEREMMRCLEGARINCREFAGNKCVMAFRDARVVVNGDGDDGKGKESVVEMISSVCFGGERVRFGIRPRSGFRIVKGSDLLGKQL